mgnify:FL=1
MSVLTRVNNIPVYTNIDEALSWAKYNGLSGYHIHKHMSVTGYMGGRNHASMPLKTIELPVKQKGKAGYLPELGSIVVSVINGVASTTKVRANTTYNAKGVPIEVDEKSIVTTSQPRIINQPTAQETPTTTTTSPIFIPTQRQSSGGGSYSGGGGGGGGGY